MQCNPLSKTIRQIPSNSVKRSSAAAGHPTTSNVLCSICQIFSLSIFSSNTVKFLYPSFTHSFVNSLKYCNNVTLVTSLKTTFFIVFHSFILLIAQYSHINNLRLDTLHHEFGPGMQVTVDWSRVANINI